MPPADPLGDAATLAGRVTARHAFAAAAIAAREPARVSPRRRGPAPVAPSPSTHRMVPARTSCASQDTLTWLSRPEKPPMPATAAFWEMIAAAALVWLETASVPPPWVLMYESACSNEASLPKGP